MSIDVKPLFPDQKATEQDGKPTVDLVEIIQRLVDAIEDFEARVTALEP